MTSPAAERYLQAAAEQAGYVAAQAAAALEGARANQKTVAGRHDAERKAAAEMVAEAARALDAARDEHGKWADAHPDMVKIAEQQTAVPGPPAGDSNARAGTARAKGGA